MIPKQPLRRLVRGDLVEVRSADEILATLDERGTLDDLPFMPEMLDFIGKKYRVHRRVEHFAFDGAELCEPESSVRSFEGDDVVLLEDVRCSGVDHGGCKRDCMVFWKEAWLRKTTPEGAQGERADLAALESRLRTRQASDPKHFFCQSSQLLVASRHLGWKNRIFRCARNVASGNYGLLEMARNLLVWSWCRGSEKLLGMAPVGKLKKTPAESLELQVGELVEVKQLHEIKQTLDRCGCNRGLHFSREMIPYCGKRLRVATRADCMVAEGIGNMRIMQNTVILENSVCDSATWAFGACPREDHIYWREIWLKRVNDAHDKKLQTTRDDALVVEKVSP